MPAAPCCVPALQIAEGLEGTNRGESALHWYALRTKPRVERGVRDALQWHNLEAYLPAESGPRRAERPGPGGVRPLFPGYVFCRTSLDVPVRIVRLPGVLGFVGCKGVPLAVADEEVSALRRLEESRRAMRSIASYAVGQRVRVCSGALQGLEGWVQRVRKHHQLVIAVNLLKNAVCVSLEDDCVEPA